jgi:hypothetical protein
MTSWTFDADGRRRAAYGAPTERQPSWPGPAEVGAGQPREPRRAAEREVDGEYEPGHFGDDAPPPRTRDDAPPPRTRDDAPPRTRDDAPARSERPARRDRAERRDRPERADRAERRDRPERAGRAERAARRSAAGYPDYERHAGEPPTGYEEWGGPRRASGGDRPGRRARAAGDPPARRSAAGDPPARRSAAGDPAARRSARRPASRPAPARNSGREVRSFVLVVLAGVFMLTAVGGVAYRLGYLPGADDAPAGAPRAARPAGPALTDAGGPSASPGPGGPPSAGPARDVPRSGPGSFAFGTAQGQVFGGAGTLRRFRVAVEDGVGQDPEAFGVEVDRILGDGRGWTAAGDVRFQRVPRAAPADFTVLLATPATSEAICRTAGLTTEGYTSCRLPGQVVINLARWLTAIPGYGAPLDVYRAYAVNHEVGHELGKGHEACPAEGRVAPVMQQQTLGLKGCTANAWPFLDGRRYAGPAVP